MPNSGVVFKVALAHLPETGNELVRLLTQAVESVRYNIGPEPVRFTTGPVYRDTGMGRVGTWGIEKSGQGVVG